MSLALCNLHLAQAQTASLLSPDIQIPTGETDYTLSTYIQINGVKNATDQLEVVPLWGPLFQPKLQLSKLERKYQTSTEQFWLASWKFSGSPPSQPVIFPLLLSFANAPTFARLSVSSKPSPPINVTVRPPLTTWRINKNSGTSFTIDTGEAELHEVQVSASTLAEVETKELVGPEQFVLDNVPTCKVDWNTRTPIQVHGTPATVYLCFNPSFSSSGKYTGQVWIGAKEKHDLSSFQLEILSTSVFMQIVGIVLIAIGVAIFFIVTVVIRRRANRLSAMLPAARLRDAVLALLKRLGEIEQQTGAKWADQRDATMIGSLAYIVAQLETSNLDRQGFLPLIAGNPFAQQTLDSNYQVALQKFAAQVDALTIFINEGLGQCAKRWPTVIKLGEEAAGHKAIAEICKLFPFSGPSEGLRRQLASIVAQLEQQLRAAAGVGGRLGGGPSPPEPTVEQINVQLNYSSWLMFFIWALFTVFAGTVALIWSRDGFGTPPDLVRCFLWGLGLQAAGSSLQQIGPSAITNAFSVQIFR